MQLIVSQTHSVNFNTNLRYFHFVQLSAFFILYHWNPQGVSGPAGRPGETGVLGNPVRFLMSTMFSIYMSIHLLCIMLFIKTYICSSYDQWWKNHKSILYFIFLLLLRCSLGRFSLLITLCVLFLILLPPDGLLLWSSSSNTFEVLKYCMSSRYCCFVTLGWSFVPSIHQKHLNPNRPSRRS